jgi:CRP-like cAMP-binding protein
VDAAPEAPAAETEAEAEVYAIAPKPKPQREAPPPKQWKCKAGKTIFREEESSFDIFILEEGKVEIIVAEERVAVVSTPGLVLGEVGALLRRPRSAAVKALTDCTFTVYQDFEALMHHDADKLLEVARTLATRLADTNEKIEKVLGVLYQAKVKDDIVDNISLVLRGKKPKPHQKQGFLAKLGLG